MDLNLFFFTLFTYSWSLVSVPPLDIDFSFIYCQENYIDATRNLNTFICHHQISGGKKVIFPRILICLDFSPSSEFYFRPAL